MINSVGGFGTIHLSNQKAVGRKGTEAGFKQVLDTASIAGDEDMDGRYGITPEQKKELRDKYGNVDLQIGSDNTHRFFEELQHMGAITEAEARYGDFEPEWPCPPDGCHSATPADIIKSDLHDADIRSSFRSYGMLQRLEAKKTSGTTAEMFNNASDVYEKLANIMDYIFD